MRKVRSNQLNQHVKEVHKAPPVTVQKVRPRRIAARRAHEIMAVIMGAR